MQDPRERPTRQVRVAAVVVADEVVLLFDDKQHCTLLGPGQYPGTDTPLH